MVVKVIFPLAVPTPYSYLVPEHLKSKVSIGKRVEVELKNKVYSALIYEIIDKEPGKQKEILDVLDEIPIVDQKDFDFWKWIAEYYSCTMGEVMQMALPSGLKLESQTIIMPGDVDYQDEHLSDEEFLVAEAISIRQELTINEVKSILNKKTIYPVIRALLDKEIIKIKEELIERFSEKKIKVVSFTNKYIHERGQLAALDLVEKSTLQTKALLSMINHSRATNQVPLSVIYEETGVTLSVIKALEKKDICTIKEITTSRLSIYDQIDEELPELNDGQELAMKELHQIFEEKKAALIFGVTGSGKTRIYIDLITECINEGKQAIFLLPEIALTTQMVTRIERVFGESMMVYHSRMNDNERVEMWHAAKTGMSLVMGARSSLFLPFKNLGLVIIDEEHDPSYKQGDPAPRYNARDVALVLAKMSKAKIVLGSATPSIETFYNSLTGKYGKVSLKERFGQVAMPNIEVIDLSYEKKTGRLKSNLSFPLIEAMKETIANKEQIILFQNRRGFAPIIQCRTCGWSAGCENCDVSLTSHKYFQELRCHYCGFRQNNPVRCPACGGNDLDDIGVGTERIEQEVEELFPDARIARLDYDTTRSKSNFEQIIYDFSAGKIDILIGTQMITKGFDFEKVTLVGIVSADSLLMSPSFRGAERAFQLMMQVAGRAGRRSKQGKVLIQAFRHNHPVITEVIAQDYERFFNREIVERKDYQYPPFYKMIYIQLKHRDPKYLHMAGEKLLFKLKSKLQHRVVGIAQPSVSRIKNMYIEVITIKIELDMKAITATKQFITYCIEHLKNKDGIKSLRINIDIDPS